VAVVAFVTFAVFAVFAAFAALVDLVAVAARAGEGAAGRRTGAAARRTAVRAAATTERTRDGRPAPVVLVPLLCSAITAPLPATTWRTAPILWRDGAGRIGLRRSRDK